MTDNEVLKKIDKVSKESGIPIALLKIAVDITPTSEEIKELPDDKILFRILPWILDYTRKHSALEGDLWEQQIPKFQTILDETVDVAEGCLTWKEVKMALKIKNAKNSNIQTVEVLYEEVIASGYVPRNKDDWKKELWDIALMLANQVIDCNTLKQIGTFCPSDWQEKFLPKWIELAQSKEDMIEAMRQAMVRRNVEYVVLSVEKLLSVMSFSEICNQIKEIKNTHDIHDYCPFEGKFLDILIAQLAQLVGRHIEEKHAGFNSNSVLALFDIAEDWNTHANTIAESLIKYSSGKDLKGLIDDPCEIPEKYAREFTIKKIEKVYLTKITDEVKEIKLARDLRKIFIEEYQWNPEKDIFTPFGDFASEAVKKVSLDEINNAENSQQLKEAYESAPNAELENMALKKMIEIE